MSSGAYKPCPGRKCWVWLTLIDKRRLVAEVETSDSSFVEVVRRHDINRGLQWNWRCQIRCAKLVAEPIPRFVLVQVLSEPLIEGPRERVQMSSSHAASAAADSRIEIRLPDGLRFGLGATLVW